MDFRPRNIHPATVMRSPHSFGKAEADVVAMTMVILLQEQDDWSRRVSYPAVQQFLASQVGAPATAQLNDLFVQMIGWMGLNWGEGLWDLIDRNFVVHEVVGGISQFEVTEDFVRVMQHYRMT